MLVYQDLIGKSWRPWKRIQYPSVVKHGWLGNPRTKWRFCWHVKHRTKWGPDMMGNVHCHVWLPEGTCLVNISTCSKRLKDSAKIPIRGLSSHMDPNTYWEGPANQKRSNRYDGICIYQKSISPRNWLKGRMTGKPSSATTLRRTTPCWPPLGRGSAARHRFPCGPWRPPYGAPGRPWNFAEVRSWSR